MVMIVLTFYVRLICNTLEQDGNTVGFVVGTFYSRKEPPATQLEDLDHGLIGKGLLSVLGHLKILISTRLNIFGRS